MTGEELQLLTSGAAFSALLWNVVNEIRKRTHEKNMRETEAHLRVTSELKLRLHQQGWALLKETHEAAFPAYDAIRNYALAAIVYERSKDAPIPLWGDAYQKTMAAVQRFSALAHISPPKHQLLREAASGFSQALNLVNESLLSKTRPSEQQQAVMKVVTDALATAALGTREWNEELWQHQSVTALTKAEK